MTAQDLFALQLRLTTLLVEAQSVVALRMLGLSGVIPVQRGESLRMVHEKGPAIMESFFGATDAVIAGKCPDQIMLAALSPVSSKVRSNRRRLTT